MGYNPPGTPESRRRDRREAEEASATAERQLAREEERASRDRIESLMGVLRQRLRGNRRRYGLASSAPSAGPVGVGFRPGSPLAISGGARSGGSALPGGGGGAYGNYTYGAGGRAVRNIL